MGPWNIQTVFCKNCLQGLFHGLLAVKAYHLKRHRTHPEEIAGTCLVLVGELYPLANRVDAHRETASLWSRNSKLDPAAIYASHSSIE